MAPTPTPAAARGSHDPLRPGTLAEFHGQPDVARELGIVLSAAKARGEIPPHLLFTGPPGLGKTTLASIVAAESGLPMKMTSAPLLDKPGNLVSLLVSLVEPTVVFVDEVHQLDKAVEETLYTAMEDGRVDIVIQESSTKARSIPMPLEPFVLVGATTKSGNLGGPFRDRFGYTARLKLYDTTTLAGIIKRSAALLGAHIDDEAATVVAGVSRGTPRVANHWLRRVRDYADTTGAELIDPGIARAALTAFGVDQVGLDAVDREVLSTLCTQYAGGPVGVGTLATSIGEAAATLEEVHEPYLMRLGFIARTPRGRVATPAAYEHLNLPVPARVLESVGLSTEQGTLPLSAAG